MGQNPPLASHQPDGRCVRPRISGSAARSLPRMRHGRFSATVGGLVAPDDAGRSWSRWRADSKAVGAA